MMSEVKRIQRYSRGYRGEMSKDPNGPWVLVGDAAERNKALTENLNAERLRADTAETKAIDYHVGWEKAGSLLAEANQKLSDSKQWSQEQSKDNEILRGLINEGLGRETALQQEVLAQRLQLVKCAEQIEAQQQTEAALREELANAHSELRNRCSIIAADLNNCDNLQQRLIAAEQRNSELSTLLSRAQRFAAYVHKCVRKNGEYAPLHWQEMVELDHDLSAAIKPTESGASE